jgi:hypothetical protein
MQARTGGLTNLQLELLKIFARTTSEEELLEIKKTLSQYFAKKAISAADKVWDEKGWTKKEAGKILRKHVRTPYRRNA